MLCPRNSARPEPDRPGLFDQHPLKGKLMSDSTLLLIVSLVGSILLSVLLAAWLIERARYRKTIQHLKAEAKNVGQKVIQEVVDGTAHPLTAWRFAAGVSGETLAQSLGVSAKELAAFEGRNQNAIEKGALLAVIAAHAPILSLGVAHKNPGGVTGSTLADGTPAPVSSENASVGSVSDGGMAIGG